MKKVIILFALSIIVLTGAFAQNTPVEGATVKLGQNPAGNIIATTVTGADGVFEFKNVPAGTGYFITVVNDFGIREKGIKSATQQTVSEEFEMKTAGTTKMAGPGWTPSYPASGQIALVTLTGKDGTIRATIVLSRSNIKSN